MSRVLCSISTKGRYDTTLSMSIQSVINQTRKIDHLVIFDDNDEDKVKDLREIQVYKYLFSIMDLKGISWQVNYGKRLGQHHNHQVANTMGFEWVWRVDDDCVPEPHVLDTLMRHTSPTVGAVGGSILTPPFAPVTGSTGRIEDIYEPSIQWDYIKEKKEVDHLHCSFIYRAGIVDYNLALSKVAFREETLFTYGLRQRGYQIFVVPDANTWHLKNQYGGVRTETKEMFEHDDWIFHNYMKYKDNTIVVLDSGLGDHLVFKHVLPDIKNPVIFSCYPDIIPGESIGEAYRLFGNIDQYNIYGKMDQWKWTSSLEDAFRKMYIWEMP
jgi:glycosyltransferase involved in cell wall biosynthesis